MGYCQMEMGLSASEGSAAISHHSGHVNDGVSHCMGYILLCISIYPVGGGEKLVGDI